HTKSVFAFVSCFSVALVSFISVAHAEGCVKEQRDITYEKDSTEITSYRCPLDTQGVTGLLVTFYRFNATLAGSIVTHKTIPEFEKLFGPLEIVDNNVAAVAKALFDNYGSETKYDFADGDAAWTIETPK